MPRVALHKKYNSEVEKSTIRAVLMNAGARVQAELNKCTWWDGTLQRTRPGRRFFAAAADCVHEGEELKDAGDR